MPPFVDMVDRFWSKVDRSGECWEWTGSVNRYGYGRIAKPRNAGPMLAHRYSAMLHFGMFDTRLLVCHSCDNPKCVRPEHLFIGDMQQNMDDMVAKGRAWGGHAPSMFCRKGHKRTGLKVRCQVCVREGRARRALIHDNCKEAQS